MSMPKTPVDEYSLSARRKRHVRHARQITPVQPVAVARAMRETPDNHFRRSIFPLYRLHDAATLFCRFVRDYLTSIFKLGSVSNSSTISL